MEVIVYSMPGCQFCSMVRDFLNRKGIGFREYDVSEDKGKAREMVAKSRQRAVPVIDVDGRIIVGFRPDAIEKALNAPKFDRDAYMSNVVFDPFDQ